MFYRFCFQNGFCLQRSSILTSLKGKELTNLFSAFCSGSVSNNTSPCQTHQWGKAGVFAFLCTYGYKLSTLGGRIPVNTGTYMAWLLNLRTACQMILAFTLHNQGEGCKCSLAWTNVTAKSKCGRDQKTRSNWPPLTLALRYSDQCQGPTLPLRGSRQAQDDSQSRSVSLGPRILESFLQPQFTPTTLNGAALRFLM